VPKLCLNLCVIGRKAEPMHNAIPIHLAIDATRRLAEASGPKPRRVRRPRG
jgi:hypothetical protein